MKTSPYTTLISSTALAAILNSDHTVVLDCRYDLADADKGRKAYLQQHIPGAYYLDLAHDLSSPVIKGVTGRHPLPHPDVLAATLRAAGLHSNSQAVVYDHSNGMYAARAWWLLRWLGHDRVALLDGGFTAWLESNLPTDNQWPAPKSGTFQPAVQERLTVAKEDIVRKPGTLVDSRDHRRYTGEIEPIDPVAGHIEGAICLPYAANTDGAGRWKPLEELRNRFAEITPQDGSAPVFYCGSGVTACHNILAYFMATGKDARLYPGSWSEWLNYYPAVTGDFPTFDPAGGQISPAVQTGE